MVCSFPDDVVHHPERVYHTNAHKIKLKFALRREKKRKKGIHRPTSEKKRSGRICPPSRRPGLPARRPLAAFAPVPRFCSPRCCFCARPVSGSPAVQSSALVGRREAALRWARLRSTRPIAAQLLRCCIPAPRPLSRAAFLWCRCLVSGWRSWLRCENLRTVRRWAFPRRSRCPACALVRFAFLR